MEIIYFSIVAVALYFAADWIVNRIEVALGRRLDHRTLLFFVILLGLAVAAFAVIRRTTGLS